MSANPTNGPGGITRRNFLTTMGAGALGATVSENGRDRFARVGRLLRRVDEKAGAGKMAGGAIGAGQHDGAPDLLPIFIEGQLLVLDRRVGHHLVLPAMGRRHSITLPGFFLTPGSGSL
jgi:hypothetical protein